MPHETTTKSQTSNKFPIFVQDSSSTTGAGLAGLAYNTSGLIAYYKRDGDTTATAITLATATLGTYTSGGFKEIDATHMPGWYEVGIPDAAFTQGRWAGVHFQGATNMAPTPLFIVINALDYQDSVRAGLTALPNAAAGASGGLPIGDGSGHVTFNNTSLSGSVGSISGVTFPTDFADLAIDGSGRVTVGGYASGQDPGTLVTATAAIKAILSYCGGKYTYDSGTGVLTFYAADNTTPLFNATLSFDVNGNITERDIS